MTLEPYQLRAVHWLQPRRQALVKSPAGSGKTILASAAADLLVRSHQRSAPVRIGWIAPTIETRQQALAAIAKFPALAAQDIKVECASVHADMSDRQILIVDECKHAAAPMWRRIVEQCDRRWGFDASPFGDDTEKNAQLRSLFGEELFEVNRSEVGPRLVQGRILMVDASDDCGPAIDAEIERLTEKMKRQATFTGLSDLDIKIRATGLAVNEIGIRQNAARNAAIVRLAQQHREQPVLVLVNAIEHGEQLACGIGSGARAVSADLGKKARREAMDAVKSGACKCLVATSLGDEGLDLPMLEVLILASGGKSKIKAEQRTGRVLRAWGEKTEGIVYDFLDLQHRTMAAHSRKRQALYRSLGYRIETL